MLIPKYSYAIWQFCPHHGAKCWKHFEFASRSKKVEQEYSVKTRVWFAIYAGVLCLLVVTAARKWFCIPAEASLVSYCGDLNGVPAVRNWSTERRGGTTVALAVSNGKTTTEFQLPSEIYDRDRIIDLKSGQSLCVKSTTAPLDAPLEIWSLTLRDSTTLLSYRQVVRQKHRDVYIGFSMLVALWAFFFFGSIWVAKRQHRTKKTEKQTL